MGTVYHLQCQRCLNDETQSEMANDLSHRRDSTTKGGTQKNWNVNDTCRISSESEQPIYLFSESMDPSGKKIINILQLQQHYLKSDVPLQDEEEINTSVKLHQPKSIVNEENSVTVKEAVQHLSLLGQNSSLRSSFPSKSILKQRTEEDNLLYRKKPKKKVKFMLPSNYYIRERIKQQKFFS